MTTTQNQIKTFLQNQTIFLTGGTGFVGKILIEKLLRECEDIRIYVLVRPKKGKTLDQRFNEMFKYACFDLVKGKSVNLQEKVRLIEGDCQLPQLGISDEDAEMLKKEVSVVLHVAANVRFDQSLKDAAVNVRATRDVLELAKGMSGLKAFVYVSTAYSNCTNFHIKEEVYNPPMTPECLLEMVNNLDDATMERITPGLLGNWPNMYVYSKCISESLVQKAEKFFPTTILRPAIVGNSYEEPFPGWVDNFYGSMAVTVGAGYGILRSAYIKKECYAFLVPVDYVCNFILAATWKTVTSQNETTSVYNYTNFEKEPITWEKYMAIHVAHIYTKSPNKMIWYNSFKMRGNKLWHQISVIFLHKLPAYIFDAVLLCLGKKPMVVKLYRKIDSGVMSFSFFVTRNWKFDDDNVGRLWNDMTEEDKKTFRFSMKELDWEKYFCGNMDGIKKYLTNDGPQESEFKKRIKVIGYMLAHYSVIFLFWYIVYKFTTFVCSFFW